MKKIIILLSIVLVMGSCTSSQFNQAVDSVLETLGDSPVTEQEIGQGLKQALEQGITKGVSLVSKTDGYFKNPSIKIPFPKEAVKVENTLRDLGFGGEVDKVVKTLNRAAEDAATAAKPIFVNAIKKLTFKDVMNILKGNDNAATDYLRRVTSKDLHGLFKPKIKTSLNKVNGTKYWGDLANTYNKIPLVNNKVDTDLPEYVTGQALKGLFTMVEKEEKAIRKDPIKRGTELMKKVFALQD